MDLHSEFENRHFFSSSRMDRRAAGALAGLAAEIQVNGVELLETITARDFHNLHFYDLVSILRRLRLWFYKAHGVMSIPFPFLSNF